ncbi:MAG TPA: PfkB family carbohydrate kinase [Candidatus Binatia bacterium]|nr:PfkB family carbohydrate kinase [Candidatus Binatia bacterium]
MTELLIVGGLTIDRFADGRSAPGGSVLHAALAAVEEGVRPALWTVAGDEPQARDGLARLAALGDLVHQAAGSTTTYRHEEEAGRRVLVYEAATDPIDPALGRDVRAPEVALLAPIADELPAGAVAVIRSGLRPRRTVLLIQGWLRRLDIGAPVQPLPLEAVGDDLWAAFGAADAVVLSTEDLAEAAGDPFEQAAALRHWLGPAPVLVLTLGSEGYLLDDPAADWVVATMPRRVVELVPTIGAGDAFGAAFAVHLSRGADAATAASAAAERVIRVLESRRR